MTVGELIIELEELEQDKGVGVLYDSFRCIEPTPDERVDAEDAEYYNKYKSGDGCVKAGDYLILA